MKTRHILKPKKVFHYLECLSHLLHQQCFSSDNVWASADAPNPVDEADDVSTLLSEDTTSPKTEEGLSISRVHVLSVVSEMFSPNDIVASASAVNNADRAYEGPKISSAYTTSTRAECF